MNGHYKTKLNRVLHKWPRDTVAVYSWLNQYGIYRKLVESYKRNGTLLAFGHGGVVRPDDRVDWQGALYTIQAQLGRKIHVGGRTALELLGYGYSLPLGKRVLYLLGLPRERLPLWFRKHEWPVYIRFVTTALFASQHDVGLTSYSVGDFAITLSSPERAILEALYFVPVQASYEESKSLMEGLATLRPELIQALLVACRSVKVKRLFMFFAETLGHPWKNKLDLSWVNLGRGKRVLWKNGHLDPKYLITVPEARESVSDSSP